MQQDTITRLIALALDPSAPDGEARASWWRIMAAARNGDEVALSFVRKQGSSSQTADCAGCAAHVRAADNLIRRHAAELEAQRRTIEHLERELGRTRREAEPAQEQPRREQGAGEGRARGARGARIITARYPGRCADPSCRAEFGIGDRIRWYGRGRSYCLKHEEEAA